MFDSMLVPSKRYMVSIVYHASNLVPMVKTVFQAMKPRHPARAPTSVRRKSSTQKVK